MHFLLANTESMSYTVVHSKPLSLIFLHLPPGPSVSSFQMCYTGTVIYHTEFTFFQIYVPVYIRLDCNWNEMPIFVVIFFFSLSNQFSSVQLLSRVWLFATPWIAACQASLSITNSQSSLKLMSIESVMPSSHLILCCPLLLLPPIPPSIRVFSNESTLRIWWPKYWSFSFSITPSKEHLGLISFIYLFIFLL